MAGGTGAQAGKLAQHLVVKLQKLKRLQLTTLLTLSSKKLKKTRSNCRLSAWHELSTY